MYDKISMDTGRTQLMGGGLIVAPPSKMKPAVVVEEGEGGEGREEGRGGEGEGRVKDLEKRLLKVMREKEQLRQTNSQLQKNLTELQKQVRYSYNFIKSVVKCVR